MARELVFAIFMTPQGPQMESKMDPRFALRVLAGIAEDMREEIAAQSAKEAIQSERRIVVEGANGVNGVIVGERK